MLSASSIARPSSNNFFRVGSLLPMTREALRLISGVVLRVERDKSKEVAIPVTDRADLLAQPQGIHFHITRSFQVADVLPLVTRVAVERVPFQIAQSPQGRNDLFQLRGRQPEKDVLEFRTVQVEPNPTYDHEDAQGASSTS